VFLAEIGYAGRVWPALTFAVVAAVGLRHVDLAYRVRGSLANGIDRRGLGWEGRMIAVGIAAVIGIAPLAYSALALYLWWRVARDWAIGWSARHAAIDR
jgi:NAD(P)H-flavin reductase